MNLQKNFILGKIVELLLALEEGFGVCHEKNVPYYDASK